MSSDITNPEDQLPLSPIVFHMMLALADGEKHGYRIMKAVEEDTDGQMTIRVGSLYGTIRRMIDAGLIEETDERPDPELDDERRRYYRLTGLGEKVLSAEVKRLDHLLALARQRRVPGTSQIGATS